MTLEEVLKRRMAAILLKETPYVLEEARFGMFDLAVYIREDMAFDDIHESRKLSAVRACSKYQLDGTCAEKKKTFLDNFQPVHDDECMLRGFIDKRTGEVLPERDFHSLLSNKRTMKAHMACDVDEEGHGCPYLDQRLEWDQGFFAGHGLKQGLHLFEFKSDHDNVNRFLEQLPHYSMVADYVWLVIGKEQKMPKWLPTYVGVFQESGDSFVKLKESDFIRRLPPLSPSVLRECGIPDRAIDDSRLYEFMRKWLINSIFYRYNGLVMPMPELDHLFSEYEKREKKRAKQSTLGD